MDQLSPTAVRVTGCNANATLVQNGTVFSLSALTADGDKHELEGDKFDPVAGGCLIPLTDSREIPLLVPVVNTSGGLVLSVTDSINVSQVALNALPNGVDLQTTAHLLAQSGSVGTQDGQSLFAVQEHTENSNVSENSGGLEVDHVDHHDHDVDGTHPSGLDHVSLGVKVGSEGLDLASLADKRSRGHVHTAVELTLADARTDEPKKRKGGWPKGKKRKKEKESGVPKAPATAYVLYAIERRQEIRNAHHDLPFAEVTKILGSEWSTMAKDKKQKYILKAEADKKRYIEELKDYQQSEAYQNFLKKKKMKGMMTEEDPGSLDSQYGEYSSFLSELEEEGLYCKICNQYFSSIHNRKEHMFGKLHLQNVTSEFQKEVERDENAENEALLPSDHSSDIMTSESDQSLVGQLYRTTCSSGGLNVDGFIQQFMEKNQERESEIHELRKAVEGAREHNIAVVSKIQELKEMENKLVSDLANLKAYSMALAAQIDGLRMVPTLFGMINF